MSLLEFEAKILGNDTGTEVVDETSEYDSFGLLLKGVQNDVENPAWVQVKESDEGLHLSSLHDSSSL